MSLNSAIRAFSRLALHAPFAAKHSKESGLLTRAASHVLWVHRKMRLAAFPQLLPLLRAEVGDDMAPRVCRSLFLHQNRNIPQFSFLVLSFWFFLSLPFPFPLFCPLPAACNAAGP
jgi:hypothetical protein